MLLATLAVVHAAADDAHTMLPGAAVEIETPFSAIYRTEPDGPIVWPPPPPIDPARARLASLDTTTNEFSAPPLIVSRITGISPGTNTSPAVIIAAFERNLLKERVDVADRLFRSGDTTNAIALVADLDRYVRDPKNRSTAFNRIAAYHFRLQQYEEAAVFMRQAWDLLPGDPIAACNLAAVLMTVGRLDEALGILLEAYGQPIDRPVLAFSIHFNLACVYSLKGESEKALQNLALAAQIDPASTATSMGDPQLDRIRSDSAFVSLQRSLESFLGRAPPARQ